METIIDAEKLQNEQFIKKERLFICNNLECKAELKAYLSDDSIKKIFLFIKKLRCPICGFSFMNLSGDKKMRAITPQEKIGQKSKDEIVRITYLLDKYAKENKYSFIDAVSFLMAKTGYKKYNYIPKDNDDLFLISQLSIKYMMTYTSRAEEFIQTVLNCYEYCKANGYPSSVNQSTLKLGGN